MCTRTIMILYNTEQWGKNGYIFISTSSVVQSELLQAQSEVRRLLDRVAEASRDRSEMVSNRVHTQLIQIADERAEVAERRNLELERQVKKYPLV